MNPAAATTASAVDDTQSRRKARRRKLSRASRVLHYVDTVTTHPVAGSTCIFAVGLAFVGVVLSHFDARVQAIFATLCAGVTVAMMFVLQHTQQRGQLAMQVKLDELIRALPRADNRAVHIEVAPAEELAAFEHRQLVVHNDVRKNEIPSASEQ